MKKDQLILLEKYVQYGKIPMLIRNIPINIFSNSVILDADIDRSELTGHYEGDEYVAPDWFKKLENKDDENYVALIIKDIDEIDSEEQRKFIEILKYKKVSTFELPENCIILVSIDDRGKNNKINEEVYSLLADI